MRVLTRADFNVPKPYPSDSPSTVPYATSEGPDYARSSPLLMRPMRGSSASRVSTGSATLRVLGFRYPGK